MTAPQFRTNAFAEHMKVPFLNPCKDLLRDFFATLSKSEAKPRKKIAVFYPDMLQYYA